MQAWVVPLLLLVGGLLTVQAAANVQLSTAMRSPLGASTLQLALASALLLVAAAAVGGLGAFGMVAGVTGWHLLGGLGSAVYITAGIVAFPRLGALVTVGLFITGQMLASLLLDTLGLLGVTAEPLRLAAVLGVLAVLAGAALITRAQVPDTAATAPAPAGVAIRGASAANAGCPNAAPAEAQTAEPSLPAAATTAPAAVSATSAPQPAVSGQPGAPTRRVVGRRLLVGFAILGGAVLPVQGAINAQLRLDLGAPFVVAALSFLLATAAMVVVLALALRLTRTPRPQLTPLATVPWWGWLGGLVGAVYVTAVFLLIPLIGVPWRSPWPANNWSAPRSTTSGCCGCPAVGSPGPASSGSRRCSPASRCSSSPEPWPTIPRRVPARATPNRPKGCL